MSFPYYIFFVDGRCVENEKLAIFDIIVPFVHTYGSYLYNSCKGFFTLRVFSVAPTINYFDQKPQLYLDPQLKIKLEHKKLKYISHEDAVKLKP